MPADEKQLKVLFLCTGNSCRSQMAEGWARALKADIIEPYSAGIKPHGVNPLAVRVMAEVGVDISSQKSKSLKRRMNGNGKESEQWPLKHVSLRNRRA
jgi:arsenate reductase